MFDFFMDKLIMPLVGVVLVALLIFIPYALYTESKKPGFELKKDEWHCEQSHTVTTTTFIMSGKTMVPIISSHQECTQWNRNGE